MPIEAMREAVRQLALEAAGTVRDVNKSIYQRFIAFVIILFCASPFALAALVAITILAYNGKRQHESCMEAAMIAKEERTEMAERASRERKELEERMALREERNALLIQSAVKELARSVDKVNVSVDKVTEVVSGKSFIPQKKKTEPMKSETKKSETKKIE